MVGLGQHATAQVPISLTLPGMLMSVRRVQPSKALLPISVTPSGMVTSPAGASVLDQNAVLNDIILLVFHDDHHASHNMVCIKREENMQTNGRLS